MVSFMQRPVAVSEKDALLKKIDENSFKSTNNGFKVYLYPNFLFDMWKGHILEVHCTNIQLKIFIK